MKKIVILVFGLLAIHSVRGQEQAAPETLKERELTLKERFLLMKSKSQSYRDYKVIKETVLDGVWKITQDSIKSKEMGIDAAKANIARLEKELSDSKNVIKAKEEAVAGILHDSTHINVFGIDVNKTAFISFVVIVFAGLVFLLLLVSGRLKLMYSNLREKIESLKTVNQEFDDFKHKALEKQIKLSRELQNERNKLQELRSH